jgi:hypothetical protein
MVKTQENMAMFHLSLMPARPGPPRTYGTRNSGIGKTGAEAPVYYHSVPLGRKNPPTQDDPNNMYVIISS